MAYQWDYKQNIPSSLTVQQLDNIASAVFNPAANSTTWGRVTSFVLLGAAIAYVFAREKIVSAMEQYAKQQYQGTQTGGNQNEVNNQEPTKP